MHHDEGAFRGKVVKPGGVFDGHVYAPMAHGVTEIVVPISAMYAVLFVEVHGVGDILKIIPRTSHIVLAEFNVDFELPDHGGVAPGARGDEKGTYQFTSLVSAQRLFRDIDIDPALTGRNTGVINEVNVGLMFVLFKRLDFSGRRDADFLTRIDAIGVFDVRVDKQ